MMLMTCHVPAMTMLWAAAICIHSKLTTSSGNQKTMLLQTAVIIDPYARSIVGRRQYGQLAQVRYLFFHRIAVLLPGGTKQFLGSTSLASMHTLAICIAWHISSSQLTS